MKKLICLVMSLMLLVSSTAALAEKTKLTALTSAVFNTEGFPFPVFQKVAEEANVEIEWTAVQSLDWGNRKTAMLNAGQLPDLWISCGLSDAEASNGSFIDLAPYIDQMPNVKAFFDAVPEARYRCTTTDGKIYGLPNLVALRPQSGDTLYVNQEWLDKLNMEVPTTTEEFHNMLYRFVNEDPNGNGIADEIGYTGYGATYTGGDLLTTAGILGFVFPAFGVLFSSNDMYCMVKDGQLEFQPMTDNYRAALEYLHTLYEEKLIDPEFFVIGPMDMMTRLRSNPLIVGAASGWSKDTFAADNSPSYTMIAPLTGPNGDCYWDSSSYAFSMASNKACISTDCKDIDAALRVIDALYDEWTCLQATYGSEGVTFELDADGHPVFMETPEGYTDDEWMQQNGMNANAPGWCSPEFVATITGESTAMDKMAEDEFYSAYYWPESRMPYLVFTPEQLDEMTLIKLDVKNCIQEHLATFVVNGVTDESWNAYIDQLHSMDVERLLEIYSEAYQSYVNSAK